MKLEQLSPKTRKLKLLAFDGGYHTMEISNLSIGVLVTFHSDRDHPSYRLTLTWKAVGKLAMQHTVEMARKTFSPQEWMTWVNGTRKLFNLSR